MQQHFYNKLEAEYLNKLEIAWIKEKGWLKNKGNIYRNNVIQWGRSSIEIDVSLEPFDERKYIVDMTEPSEFDMFVRFKYLQGKDHTKMDYKVRLTTTPCNFGGWRYWFECMFCKRRVGVLYCRGGYFACRYCQNVTYEARNLSGREKLLGKTISISEVEKLERKVGRQYYNGKPTKSYMRYLRKRHKFSRVYRAKIGLLTELSNKKSGFVPNELQ